MTHIIALLLGIALVVPFISNEQIADVNNHWDIDAAIPQVINHLNAQPNRIYQHTSGHLIKYENQTDNLIQIYLKINVNCLPNKECPSDELYCVANIVKLASESYDLATDSLICDPLDDIVLKSRRRPAWCPGCPVYLNTNIPGIEDFNDAALKHIEGCMKPDQVRLVKTLQFQRQTLATIQSAVNYYLTIEVASNVCSPEATSQTIAVQQPLCEEKTFICRVTFREKPTLNNKKHIIANNCTDEQQFEYDKALYVHSIANPNTNIIFEDKNNDEDNEINSFIEPKPPKLSRPKTEEKTSPNYDEIAKNGNSDAILKIALPNYESPPQITKVDEQIIPKIDSLSKIVSAKKQASKLSNAKKEAIDELMKSFDFDQPSALQMDQEVVQPDVHNKRKRQIGDGGDVKLLDIDQSEGRIVKQVAQVALQTLDDMDSDTDKRVVLKITNVKKSMHVDGVIYHMIIKVGISNCAETLKPNENVDKCRKDLKPGMFKVCKIQVLVTKQTDTKQVLKSECHNLERKYTIANETNSRQKRDTHREKRAFGSREPFDPDSQEVQQYTNNVLTKLRELSDNPDKIQLNRVVKATKQVVAGLRIDLILELIDNQLGTTTNEVDNMKNCTVTIFSQKWKSPEDDYSIECDDDNKTSVKFRAKRSVAHKKMKRSLVGAPNILDPESDTYKELAEKALNKLDFHSNTHVKVNRVLSATKQVVAGMKYKLELEIGETSAEKQGSIDLLTREKLMFKDNPNLKNCTIVVLSQPWMSEEKEFNVNCNEREFKFRARRNVENFDDDNTRHFDVNELLNVVVNEIDRKSTNQNRFKVVEVAKVAKQTKNIYKINFKLLETENLSKNEQITYDTREKSRVKSNETPIACEMVTEQTLRSNYISVQCTNGLEFKFNDRKFLENKSSESNEKSSEESNNSSEEKNRGKRHDGEKSHEKVGRVKLHRQQVNYENEHPIFENIKSNGKRLKRSLDSNEEKFDFVEKQFRSFIINHNKNYNTLTEYHQRLNIFKQNLRKIEDFNKFEQGSGVYGVTRFADLTTNEFKRLQGFKPFKRNENDIPLVHAQIPNIELPKEFDWRKQNAVTEVKDQGFCGSCWAFSVTGNIEGLYAIEGHNLTEFSEQELVDCDKLDDGCNGGLPDTAYKAIEQLGGLETEQDYPYEAKDDKCQLINRKITVRVHGGLNITSNETGMAQWLTVNGPISIGINAAAMQFYIGGVSHPWKALCNPEQLDHGVLIVGYGVSVNKFWKKTMPYWIVKNSWGKHWGEQGYYRVYRGAGTCGLNRMATSALIDRSFKDL